MAITVGANRTETVNLIEKIKTDSSSIKETIQEQLQTGVINAIKDAWYAEEAVKFFQAFRETVESASGAIAQGINTVIGNVALSYDNWLANTNPEGAASNPLYGSGEYSEVEESETKITLDVEGIVAVGPNTETGIDEETANTVAESLPGIREAIQEALKDMQQNLDASAALIDASGAQSSAVQTFYDAQLTAIEQIFKFLTEDDGENKSLKTCIAESVTRYGESIAQATAGALNDAASGN